ncbi:hypothetical protein Tco_0771468 [Tanacetum coccineum]|uniref:Retrovirus-related Pol polyprotein from transposon TNT 1-94 n=1 Tax=Tanacetum coccineum TaxID=301880 RepID=A0ABQ4ZG62_9ASTR
MLSASNLPLFLWAEAIENACCTQNHSLIIPRHLQATVRIRVWCTSVVDLPKPPIDDSDLKPFKESGIRFTVKNGMTSLYFNFKTFCETTGVDYNNGNYVAMPQTNVVKAELIKLGLHNDRNDVLGGNKSSTDQLNSSQ